MTIPTGLREIIFPGDTGYPPETGDPLSALISIGEPFDTATAPDLDEPFDESWMKLEPVRVNGELVAIGFHQLRLTDEHVDPDTRTRSVRDTGQIVYTLGPFKSPRFVAAARAHQMRRLSLTLAAEGPTVEMRMRHFDVRLALDVDVQHDDEPRYWLDWQSQEIITDDDATVVWMQVAREIPAAVPA